MAKQEEKKKIKLKMLFIRDWIKFQGVTSYRYNFKTGMHFGPVMCFSREGRISKWPALTSTSTRQVDPLFVMSALI